MTSKFIALLSVCLLAPFSSYAVNSADSILTDDYEADPYYILMGEADDAISRENWTEAAARIADAIAVRPNADTNPLLYNNLATIYTYMGHDSLALDTYDRALEIAPAMTTTRFARGRLLLKMGDDVAAFDDFDRIISQDSLSVDARYYHGMIALYAGNRQMAEDDFDVMARVAPQSYDTAVALATLYSLTGRDREAIPYLKKLIEADPAPEYFASLAGCHLQLGDLTEASAVITDGLSHYPADPELFYYRAWLNRDRHRLDDAKADARHAIDLGASPTRVNMLFEK